MEKFNALENEVWHDYPEYEGLYLISNFGRVGTYYRSKTIISKTPAKILNHVLGRRYYHNTLCKNKVRKTCLLHRAVAKVFVENPKGYKCVNHKDGNKLNNHFSNLEWCTYRMNTRHAINNGLLDSRGEKNKQAKLSDFDVSRMKIFIRHGTKLEILAQMYHWVNKNTIGAIMRNQTWKHVQ